jgi:hypothetical protein
MINTKHCDILGQLFVYLTTSCKIFHSKQYDMKTLKKKKKTHDPFIK